MGAVAMETDEVGKDSRRRAAESGRSECASRSQIIGKILKKSD